MGQKCDPQSTKSILQLGVLLHILGYIIQLSFHVVDVNINLDLYKCIRINHRNVSLQKKNLVSLPFPASVCDNSLWWSKIQQQICIIQIKSNQVSVEAGAKNGFRLWRSEATWWVVWRGQFFLLSNLYTFKVVPVFSTGHPTLLT